MSDDFAFKVHRAHNPGKRSSRHTYYAMDRDTAEAYKAPGGTVREHDVKLKNPLVLDTPEKVKNAWKDSGAKDTPGNFYPHKQGAFNDWARSRGHDGVVVHHSAFEGEEGHKHAGGTFGEPQVVKFK